MVPPMSLLPILHLLMVYFEVEVQRCCASPRSLKTRGGYLGVHSSVRFHKRSSSDASAASCCRHEPSRFLVDLVDVDVDIGV